MILVGGGGALRPAADHPDWTQQPHPAVHCPRRHLKVTAAEVGNILRRPERFSSPAGASRALSALMATCRISSAVHASLTVWADRLPCPERSAR